MQPGEREREAGGRGASPHPPEGAGGGELGFPARPDWRAAGDAGPTGAAQKLILSLGAHPTQVIKLFVEQEEEEEEWVKF